MVLRSSGVLARCSARARRVTPYGPLEGPTTYKLPADKGPLCLVPERRAARPNFWPAACVELQPTGKPPPVCRHSGLSRKSPPPTLQQAFCRCEARLHHRRPTCTAQRPPLPPSGSNHRSHARAPSRQACNHDRGRALLARDAAKADAVSADQGACSHLRRPHPVSPHP